MQKARLGRSASGPGRQLAAGHCVLNGAQLHAMPPPTSVPHPVPPDQPAQLEAVGTHWQPQLVSPFSFHELVVQPGGQQLCWVLHLLEELLQVPRLYCRHCWPVQGALLRGRGAEASAVSKQA